MLKKSILCTIVLLLTSTAAFSQASALRDYVGMIKGTFHPDALEFFDKLKENAKKRGNTDTVKYIEDYAKRGIGGTGFVYVASDGENYVITNYHVVSQVSALSISFEKQDGAKTTYDRLKVVAADEDIDIAILTFADGAKPFKTGLAFVTTPAEEGGDVFAAGFPGMFGEQIWQFSRGVVSNASMRWPHEPEDEEGVNPARWGPYIQHTSNIDHGNSGGPLLVQQADVTTGYAVAGINTLTLSGYRENTFFAIPTNRTVAYITEALKSTDDAAQRRNLDVRLDAFIKALAKPKAVYGVIADYLSNACTASNAEFAIDETFTRAPRTVQDAILNDNISLISAMRYSVAWLVEDSFRGKSTGTLKATLGDITKNTDGSYTVPLQFSGDRVINTTWVSEYGIWMLDKAGDLVSGDKSLTEKKEQKRATDKAKGAYDDFFMLSLGYTQIFDHKIGEKDVSVADSYGYIDEYKFEAITESAPAFDIALLVSQNRYGLYRVDLVLAEHFWQLELDLGFKVPIDIKAVTIAPFATIGVGFTGYDGNKFPRDGLGKAEVPFYTIFPAQVGLMVSTTKVPGLYLLANYQYNIPAYNVFFSSKEQADIQMFKVGIGYAFTN